MNKLQKLYKEISGFGINPEDAGAADSGYYDLIKEDADKEKRIEYLSDVAFEIFEEFKDKNFKKEELEKVDDLLNVDFANMNNANDAEINAFLDLE